MRSRVLFRLLLLNLAFGAFVAAPAAAQASCIPPQFQTFAGGTDTVVLEGGIVAVEPNRVIVDALKWWGTEPTQRVAIQRPATDPTVITSVDWTPQVGETWLIVAHRQGDLLVTGTCEQLAADDVTIGEVRSSLGEPVVPQPAVDPAANQTPPVVPIAVVVALALAGLLLWRRRSASIA
jgi:MYXO-CTERM domain-containing protein